MKTEKLSYNNKNALDCFFNMNNRLKELFEIKLELERILSDSDSIKLSTKLHKAISKIDAAQKELQSIKSLIN